MGKRNNQLNQMKILKEKNDYQIETAQPKVNKTFNSLDIPILFEEIYQLLGTILIKHFIKTRFQTLETSMQERK